MKNKDGELTLFDFKTYYSNPDNVTLGKEQTYRPTEQNGESRNTHIYI